MVHRSCHFAPEYTLQSSSKPKKGDHVIVISNNQKKVFSLGDVPAKYVAVVTQLVTKLDADRTSTPSNTCSMLRISTKTIMFCNKQKCYKKSSKQQEAATKIKIPNCFLYVWQ